MTDFYRIKMIDGEVFCTTVNPMHMTGDWAIIKEYILSDEGR